MGRFIAFLDVGYLDRFVSLSAGALEARHHAKARAMGSLAEGSLWGPSGRSHFPSCVLV